MFEKYKHKGRVKTEDPRQLLINLKVTESERTHLMSLAEKSGTTLSDYLRDLLAKHAK